jgi:transposase
MTSENFSLLPDDPEPVKPPKPTATVPSTRATVRVQMPDRSQLEMRPYDLESVIPPEHRVRLVWAYVARLDLSKLYAQIKAMRGGVGRPPIAPEIMLSLWLFATLEGIGSARAVARLSEEHDAYRWLCGGVSVNYHSLADFRVSQGQILDELLTLSVANLMAVGAVTLTRVAQDGMRVRASAGSKSFRRRERLESFLTEAREQVAKLKADVESDPAGQSRREQAARERAAREREEKIDAALKRLPELEAAKERQGERGKKKVKAARTSMTDADATIMKMPNAGYNAAYNAQLCTDTETQVIVGVDMINAGVDQGQLTVMLEQVKQRYGKTPDEYLVDGGYVTHAQIEEAEEQSRIYAPVAERPKDKLAPHAPHPRDSAGVAAWRARMGTEEAKEIYKERAATAECVNALARERGLTRLRVRGLAKTKCVLLMHALAHNVMRIATLAPQLLKLSVPSMTAA